MKYTLKEISEAALDILPLATLVIFLLFWVSLCIFSPGKDTCISDCDEYFGQEQNYRICIATCKNFDLHVGD